jgi:hypothetical protein
MRQTRFPSGRGIRVRTPETEYLGAVEAAGYDLHDIEKLRRSVHQCNDGESDQRSVSGGRTQDSGQNRTQRPMRFQAELRSGWRRAFLNGLESLTR